MSRQIQHVAQFVNNIANVAEMGGRCSVLDDTRCALYDCGNWTASMGDAVVARFPTCRIDVCTYSSSISGFIVIFSLHSRMSRLRSVALLLIGCLCLFLCTFYLFLAVQRALHGTVEIAPRWLLEVLQTVSLLAYSSATPGGAAARAEPGEAVYM